MKSGRWLNVALFLMLALIAMPVSADITNGGFETGDFTGWIADPATPQTYADARVVQNEMNWPLPAVMTPWTPAQGSWFAFLTARAGGAGSTTATISRQVFLNAGEQISWTMFLDGYSAPICTSIAAATFSYSTPVLSESVTYAVSSDDVGSMGETAWTPGSFLATVTAIHEVRFSLTSFTPSPFGCAGASMGVDNVQVVPEPATSGLLALAALSTLRRKRSS